MPGASPSRVCQRVPLTEDDEIRLAFLVGRLERGGAELQMIALARGLTGHGFRVDFVCRSGAGPLADPARSAGATVRVIGQRSSPDARSRTRYVRRLAKHAGWITLARRERYDIVDAWLNPNDVFASLSRPLTRIPVVVAGRRNTLPRLTLGPATGPLYSTVYRLTDVVIANAERTAQHAIHEQGVPANRVRVIRAGVELPRTFSRAERQSRRAALGVAEGEFLIGCVGNFRPMKRHDLLIEAFSRLLPERDGLRLVLVGDGDLRPAIERQVERLGLGGRVILAGSLGDLPAIYDAMDLFVQASNSEGLPNVVLEASAAGLPIVATAAGGTGEVVYDGETGLLVPIDDLDGLTAAMHTAIGDPDLRRGMGLAARELIERDYGVERCVREYADVYREQVSATARH